MGDFLGHLIEFIARIWYADSQMRDMSASTDGSEWDRQSRRFVAKLCGSAIAFLVIVILLLWWLG